MASVTLEGLFQPYTWKRLNFYALLIPDGDVVPVRSVYGSNSGTCNIGLNTFVGSKSFGLLAPIWFLRSINGHIPDVRKAFRIVPRGKQRGLKTIKLRDAIPVDPRKEDFFTRVIEYRKQQEKRATGVLSQNPCQQHVLWDLP